MSELLQRTIPGSSGAILNCFHTVLDKAKPTLAITLPFGVRVDVARAAIDKLAPDFNIVTWESRYILNLDQEFSGDEKMAPEEHVADLLCFLRVLEISTCRLIGYCSGAGISLLAGTQHPEIFTELILVNGEYQLFRRGHAPTSFQRSVDVFLPLVATSRQQARLIFSKRSEIAKASKGPEPTELDKQMNLAYSQEEYLFRHGKNYMAYRHFDALALARGVRQRALVITGRRDIHTTMENSLAVGDAIAGSTRFIDDEGDHYEFSRAGSATLAQISAYLTRAT